MDNQDVELDTLLPQSSSPTAYNHGKQPATSLVKPFEAEQDIKIHNLPPSSPSGPTPSGQSPSNPPSIHASSATTHTEHPLALQLPANAPLADLIGDKLQSMIGLLQETVNTLRQATAAVQITNPDPALLQEVVVAGKGRVQEQFVMEKVKDDREGIVAGADSWSFIWPEERQSSSPSYGLDYYSCARDERITLQLQLFAALCHRSRVEIDFNRALYACGPLISAIGIKLQDYRWGSTRLSNRMRGQSQERISPQCLVRILIEILRHIRKGHGILNLEPLLHAGSVLKSCYLRGLLSQPADTAAESYQAHVQLICHASNLINVCYNIPLRDFSEYDRLGHSLESCNTTDKLLQTSIIKLMQAARRPPMITPENVPRADGALFHVNDFDIGTLTAIGELSVKWTKYWDEHLLIDLVQHQVTLAWFPTSMFDASLSNFGLVVTQSPHNLFRSPEELCSLSDQLAHTYRFLFGRSPYRKNSKSQNRNYGFLPVPPWMALFGRSMLKTWDKRGDSSSKNYKSQNRKYGFLPGLPWIDPFGLHTLETWDKWGDSSSTYKHMDIYIKQSGPARGLIYFCADIQNHFAREVGDQGQADSQAYSSYPHYEDRLRVLRAYMDSKKPKSFRGLWRDKRNTYSYYTFWGVIIFGGVSVLLGLLSLAVSVLQTIASWKALDPPPQGSHS